MHLLVFDDDDRIVRFMALVADQRGWTVATAGRESDFHALFRARRPDAIMLDLQLGASDGIEQLRFLHREYYRGEVVLMSGFDARVLAAAQQVGDSLGVRIAAIVEKPARAARVRAVLEAVERHMRRAEPGATPLPGASVAGAPSGAAADAAETGAAVTPEAVARGLAAGEMELHLQPIVPGTRQSALQAEALIRWRHPRHGLIAPDLFVPVAEQDDAVIDGLTRWVVQTALGCYRELDARGMATRICVNVSGRNLRALDFPDQIAALLDEARVPAGAIGLEMTESVAMADVGATADVLTRLRLKGFALAIDDFGTGYASLEALRRMPFSTLKIDKAFVADMASSCDSLAIVTSVIELAHNMGLDTVAEGVEDAESAAVLRDLGVAAMQGFHFSRPLPFGAFTSWREAWPDRGAPIVAEPACVGPPSGALIIT
jgi:EAL domain-containing protein (putative c-di-GMP-specific phosphodiesterase class I)/ActR/RegA family two-component response regulator